MTRLARSSDPKALLHFNGLDGSGSSGRGMGLKAHRHAHCAVHARRAGAPCVPNLMPGIRGAPARANRAPPCPHTDLLAAHPVQPADPCLAWVSLCVQRRSCCAEHGRSPGLQPLWCAWDEFSGPEGRQAAAGRRLGMVWCFSMLRYGPLIARENRDLAGTMYVV